MPANHKKRFSYSCLPDAKAEELRGIVANLKPLLRLHPTFLEAGREQCGIQFQGPRPPGT
jgi:hypothetical protein